MKSVKTIIATNANKQRKVSLWKTTTRIIAAIRITKTFRIIIKAIKVRTAKAIRQVRIIRTATNDKTIKGIIGTKIFLSIEKRLGSKRFQAVSICQQKVVCKVFTAILSLPFYSHMLQAEQNNKARLFPR